MAQLPRGLRDAAVSSIETYGAQIIHLTEALDFDGPSMALQVVALRTSPLAGSVAKVFDGITEEMLMEALQLLISARAESVRVLQEGLDAAEA